MDYALGRDFSPKKYWGLKFLHSLKTIAGINFIGVSVGGHPVTRKMLVAENLVGANEAIITLSDLEKITDPQRRETLRNRMNVCMQNQGQLVRGGIVNLIPLWRAAEIGDDEAVHARLLAGVDPNEKGDDLPIVLAAQHGHEAIVDVLRHHPKFDIKTLAAAIQAARQSENILLVERLMSSQDIDQLDEKGDTLLHRAVLAGDIELVKNLIVKGANVNLKGSNGYPLTIAAERSYYKEWYDGPSEDHIEILKILINHQADPNLSDDGTAMDAAGKAGSAGALSILLPITEKHDLVKKYGCDDETEVHLPWYTDIMFDSYGSHEWLDILKLLLANGADLNQTVAYEGDTLLHIAVLHGKLTAVKYLLTRGAKIDVKDSSGRTPLDYAEGDVRLILIVDPNKLPNPYVVEHSQQFQEYLDHFREKESSKFIFEKLELSEEDKDLLENYRDDVSHEIIKIPVVGNKSVFLTSICIVFSCVLVETVCSGLTFLKKCHTDRLAENAKLDRQAIEALVASAN